MPIDIKNDDQDAQIVRALYHYSRLKNCLYHAYPQVKTSGWQEMFLNALADAADRIEAQKDREAKEGV